MDRIIDQDLLDRVSAMGRDSPRLRRNYNFHLDESDASHRLLNGVEPASYIPPHRHLSPTKDESILVLRGRLGVVFFGEDGEVLEKVLLEPCGAAVGVNIPHGAFHTVVSLASGSVFFEAKAGPYEALRPEEKASWAPEEGAAEAAEYLGWLKELFAGEAQA
jgi:cupin fold WbuC family metalloprotein